jgi:hypothetical protein
MATAEERALSALSKVNQIGFAEFTSKLISETVDAVVGATIRQIKSYAELVQELSQGVAAFKAKCVTAESVQQYLADAFPAEGGGSAVAAGNTYDHALYEQIVNRFGQIDGFEDPQDGTSTFDADQVQAIADKTQALLNQAAEASYEHLRTMLQMGYARVIFTSGRIKSKLTFDVQATDNRNRTSSDLAQSAFNASAQMKGGIFGALLGVSGSTSYSQLRVRTVKASDVEADKVKGEIMGEVEVNFARWTHKLRFL